MMDDQKQYLLPTPPPSTHLSLGSVSDVERGIPSSSTGSSSLIATANEFRMGAPAPLPGLPLLSRIPNKDSPMYETYKLHQFSFHAALNAADISGYNLSCVFRFPNEHIPSEKDLTILVGTTRQDGWVTAIDSILKILHDNKIQDMFRVEIIDDRANMSYFAPKVDNAFRSAWPKIEASVLYVLGTGVEWETLSVLNQGHTEDESKPTVVVGISDEAEVGWQRDLYRDLKTKVLDEFGDINLAFVRASVFRSERLSTPISLDVSAFTGPVTLGSSIGVESKSGTMGGYVQVEYAGTVQWMAITNHHVIETDDMTAGKSPSSRSSRSVANARIDEKANGFAPSLTRTLPRVDAPSGPDKDDSVETYQLRISMLKDIMDGKLVDVNNPAGPRLGGFRQKMEMLGSDASALQQQQFATLLGNEVRLSQEAMSVRTAPRLFGHVFASSGLRRFYGATRTARVAKEGGSIDITIGNAIDWALIRVHPPRLGQNDTPDPDTKPFKELCFASPGNTISQAQKEDLQPDDIIFKKGRNGSRAGKVTEFKTDINFQDGSNRFLQAWNVQGIKLPNEGKHAAAFMSGGDSGCWGLDNFGVWNALGFAGGLETESGCMIPVKWIYDDIEARTGARILSPIMPHGSPWVHGQ